MLNLLVVYRNAASYSNQMLSIVSILENLKSLRGIGYSLREISSLSAEEVAGLLAQIARALC